MKTYLVTGGAGFIGSHLVDALLARGHRVLIIDDLSTGAVENIAHLKEHPHFEPFVDTVLNRELVTKLVARADAIFHLAAAVGVRLIVESPVRTIEANVAGADVVLSAASQAQRPILMTSSSEVYGKATKIPFAEADDLTMGNTTLARWSYGCSKALNEFLAFAYYRERQLPVIVVRLFNTAGPRQTGRYGMVLPTFVRQALSSRPITVYGDGSQRRCFCYVTDVVMTLIKLMDHQGAVGQVFNVGSDEETTIADLAERVRAATGSSSKIVRIPYEQAWDDQFEDMPRRVPDLSRVRMLVGFEPPTVLDEIIARVIEYERSLRPPLSARP